MVLGATLDNCLCFSFARRVSYRPTQYLLLMFVYDVVLVYCKKITNFGGDLNIQGARAVFKLGKPSFKKENLSNNHFKMGWFCLIDLILYVPSTIFRL